MTPFPPKPKSKFYQEIHAKQAASQSKQKPIHAEWKRNAADADDAMEIGRSSALSNLISNSTQYRWVDDLELYHQLDTR